MSNRRFQNASSDLDDCYKNMNDENLSKLEEEAKKDFVKKCIGIAVDYGYIVGMQLRKVKE